MALFGKGSEWYHLDPDNRRNPPEVKDKNGKHLHYLPHCCRCNKPMRGSAGIPFTACTVDWDKMQIKTDPLGKELIGSDCLKIVQKNPVNK